MEREKILLQSDSRLGLIPSQIVYVDGYYEESLNQFISDNIRLIENEFNRKGYDFIYFPKMDGSSFRSSNDILEMMNYFYPSFLVNQLINKNISFKLRVDSSVKANEIFSNFDYDREINPGFLRLIDNPEAKETFTFEYYQLDLQNNVYWIEIDNYFEHLTPAKADIDIDEEPKVEELKEPDQEDDDIFRLSNPFIEPTIKVTGKIDLSTINQSTRPKKKSKLEERKKERLAKETKADTLFEEHNIFSREYDIIDKIKTYIYEARQLGIYEEVIREALEALAHDSNILLDNKIKISRLVIDSNYRIFLPDYGSMEIKMTTLPKSLFILFLRHPKGIVLKQLSDYETELMKIYQIISNRENISDMTDSIKRICTPLNSSVNEKLSRIREAFVRNISEKYAEYYYVSGGRGEKKQIKLDRELMSIPEELKH